jgi:carbon-monoxide dehydrogenase large subunit
VLAVLTGADAVADKLGGLPPYFMPEDMGGPPGYRTYRPVLCDRRVRCVGDRVALVVAESVDQARDAADLITVEYEQLPCVISPDEAHAEGAPQIWDEAPRNTSFTLRFGDPDGTEAALKAAAHVVSLRIRNNRITACSIEPRCCLADWNAGEDRGVLYTSSQNPHGVRHLLMGSVFHLPESALRVVSPDVGGGFGMKADGYPEDALVLWASRRLGRPVKWVATRSEALMGDNHGRDQIADAELALDEDGHATALRVRALHGLGAYVASAAAAPVSYSMLMLPGVYAIPTVHVETSAIFTNCSPTAPYRGAGRPEACFILERLMDEAAHRLGIDRVEIRRRNLVPAESMPFQTPNGPIYDSGDFAAMMDRCLAASGWHSGWDERVAASEAVGKLRGRALTCYVESAGVFNERMELRFDAGGGATIVAGTHSHGQGHATTYAQIVHELLGLPFESIRFVQGDTDAVAAGRGTYAARSSMLGGNALKQAAEDAIAKAAVVAAELLEVDAEKIRFSDGLYRAEGGNQTIAFSDVVRSFHRPIGTPGGISMGLATVGSSGGEFPNYPNGAHVCEVEVDPATGVVRIDRYCVVDDVGHVLNPMICEGQVVGGVAQGLGQALIEDMIYEPGSGQLISGSFFDYGIPRAGMMPPIDSQLAEIPCKTNPLGVKGVGEGGTIAAPPTVVNAVLDALRPLGVDDIQMPMSPPRVWEAINDAAKTRSGEAR